MDPRNEKEMAHGNIWEDLRKRARQLENEIDLKLVSFSKLGTNYSHHRDDINNSDTSPLLSASNSEHMFDTMAMEIEQLLAKLTEINDKMSEYTNSISMSSPSSALLHTLQRHRDILQDYNQEFQKTKANITACREREELLGSVRRDIDAYKSNSGGLNRRSELYLKENEHIRNADRVADETIDVALATKENLREQRNTMKKISTGMNNLANRYPLMNSLIQRINIRKRRDSLVIGGVIAVCLILLLLYAFR